MWENSATAVTSVRERCKRGIILASIEGSLEKHLKLSLILPLAILLLSPILSQAQAETEAQGCKPSMSIPAGYSPIFADEFDDVGLDLTQWEYRYPNRPYLAGFNSETTIIQPGDGYLHLVTSYQNGTFYTGMIQSLDRFQYGYFEACIRFQSLQGHHGAFWLQSPLYGQYLNDAGRSGAEIDVIEFFGSGRQEHDAEQNVYWNPYKPEQLEERSYEISYHQQFGAELSDTFHTFGVLWTSNEYVFFIDGVETWRTSEGLSHIPENVVLSLVTSSWENARLDISRLPDDEMLMDYVRVYAP